MFKVQGKNLKTYVSTIIRHSPAFDLIFFLDEDEVVEEEEEEEEDCLFCFSTPSK